MEVLNERLCETATTKTINSYFDTLQRELQDISPESVVNYNTNVWSISTPKKNLLCMSSLKTVCNVSGDITKGWL